MISLREDKFQEDENCGGGVSFLGYTIQLRNVDSIEHFKLMVRRALNVWPDAPPEIKEFGDRLLEGKLLQDYQSQNQSMKKFTEKLPPYLPDEILKTCIHCSGLGYHHLSTCPVLKKT